MYKDKNLKDNAQQNLGLLGLRVKTHANFGIVCQVQDYALDNFESQLTKHKSVLVHSSKD